LATPGASEELSEAIDWRRLVRRIERGKCTPFLGAGASAGALPVGSVVARRWAKQLGYPLPDSHDLSRVAQYVAIVSGDAMAPKEEIQEWFEDVSPPDFADREEPYVVLASLPLPVYVTTNYDDFMMQALLAAGKQPVQEICRWTDRPSVLARASVFDRPEGFEPTPEQPVVFHLHGILELPESLVLTEDDYVDFLVQIADVDVVPARIREALADSMLLFLGYRLADWNFRVLYRGLVEKIDASGRRSNVTVQLHPDGAPAGAAIQYLERYYGAMSVRVFWGDLRAFTAKLGQEWGRRGG
jgi:hypothetical protein